MLPTQRLFILTQRFTKFSHSHTKTYMVHPCSHKNLHGPSMFTQRLTSFIHTHIKTYKVHSYSHRDSQSLFMLTQRLTRSIMNSNIFRVSHIKTQYINHIYIVTTSHTYKLVFQSIMNLSKSPNFHLT